MSDYPMLISNKLHSFRNFDTQKYEKTHIKQHIHASFHTLYCLAQRILIFLP